MFSFAHFVGIVGSCQFQVLDEFRIQQKEKVKFLDNYRLEIKEDKDYFKDAKIYRCDDCEFGFVDPMPNKETLNDFYENVYRSKGRPPYLVGENYEDQTKHYLEDKNLSYLLYC